MLLMFVAGMWFQDLWTYYFRRTEMCINSLRTQMGDDFVLRLQHRRSLAADCRDMHKNATVAGGTGSTASIPSMHPRKNVPMPVWDDPVSLSCRATGGWSSDARSRAARKNPREKRCLLGG